MRQFWERGYRATSVDDLVRATGVKPGSLYSAFPGGKHPPQPQWWERMTVRGRREAPAPAD